MCTVMQRNFDFSASFNAYYLANPNNLLTHGRATYIYAYARETCLATPIEKGFLRNSFAPCPVSRDEQKNCFSL